MQTIDPNLLYIVPTQKCLDWVNSISPEDRSIGAKYLTEHDNTSMYLISEYDTGDEAMK